jgi:hypothetical protein
MPFCPAPPPPSPCWVRFQERPGLELRRSNREEALGPGDGTGTPSSMLSIDGARISARATNGERYALLGAGIPYYLHPLPPSLGLAGLQRRPRVSLRYSSLSSWSSF